MQSKLLLEFLLEIMSFPFQPDIQVPKKETALDTYRSVKITTQNFPFMQSVHLSESGRIESAMHLVYIVHTVCRNDGNKFIQTNARFDFVQFDKTAAAKKKCI